MRYNSRMQTTSDMLLADPIGCYPGATVACFDPTCGDLPRRQLDTAKTRDYLERLARAGAPAMLIAASTGHGHLRTASELEAWFRAAAEADLGRAVKMALLRPEDGAAANARLIGVLKQAGYRVLTARDGQTALTIGRHEHPDLIVLDLMLPGGMDGLDVCRSVRQDPALADIPIVMLTARIKEADRLIGLELGADDYVTKPFSPREVVARVRAVLRRARGHGQPSGIVRVGDLAVDLTNRGVTVGGERVSLTPTEFDLLAIMARNPGRPFTRAQLLDLVYDVAYAGYDRAIDSHIKNLRRKIEPDPGEPRYVLTVYGVGYKLSDETEVK